jgi:phosphatidylglycerophosphate synthase
MLLLLEAASPAGAAARLAGLALPFGAICAGLAMKLAPGGAAAAVGLFAVIAATAVAALRSVYPHPRLGPGNAITLGRAALASALVAPLVAPRDDSTGIDWLIPAIAALALALDGLDGWLARRNGLTSSFGARFDMEVDAALGLILSLLVMASGKVGVWVLALGTMRYVYVAAGLALPWLNEPLPERFRRKAVCVLQIAALIALTAPILNGPPALVLAASATLVLGWSFAIDILWLARNHRS